VISTAPEHALLLEVSRCAPSVEALTDALQSDLDWTSIVELALHHRITPNLLAALESVPIELVPEQILVALQTYCEVMRAKGDAIQRELFALLDALSVRGVVAVPFKGAVLGEFLRCSNGDRAPGDIDLLARPQDVSSVRDVLVSRGYRDAGQGARAKPLARVARDLYERCQCEYQYVRDTDDIVVEPHWGLSQWPLALDADYEGMLDRAHPVQMFGRTVFTLGDEDLLVALCIHGTKHKWHRLSWIRDVAGLLETSPGMDLHRVLAEARSRGYERVVLMSLAVAREFAGAQLPTRTATRVARDRTLVSLLDDIRCRIFDPAAPEPRNDRVDTFRIRMRERSSDRMKYVIRTLFSPRRHHLELCALPPGFGWGYFAIKVGMDYAALPIWNAVKHRRSSRHQVAIES
jgi:hypothetical protein